jgi:serine/threonine protein kinase
MSKAVDDRLIGLHLSNGRYRVLSKLGQGGMGAIYRVLDTNIGADVVVKIPLRAVLDEPEAVARFAHEIRALVYLSDRHIVRISDVGEHDGLPFAVMQYLSGGSLEDRHGLGDDGTPLPADPQGLAGWLPSVAKALDFAHSRGYIHRDVKPPNILFDGQGEAYLGDFGASKLIAATDEGPGRKALTGSGMYLGTVGYTAPEVMMGQPPTPSTDQYSLAVTLYEVLSGRLPFRETSATAVIVKQSTTDAPSLRVARPGLPAELVRVVDLALSRDPAARFSSCSAFAGAVMAAVQLAPATAEAPPAEVPVRRTCPSCAAGFNLVSTFAGRKTKCPRCGVKLMVALDLSALTLATQETEGGTILAPVYNLEAAPVSRQTSGPREAITAAPERANSPSRPIAPAAKSNSPIWAAAAVGIVGSLGLALWLRPAVSPPASNPALVSTNATLPPALRTIQAPERPNPELRLAQAKSAIAAGTLDVALSHLGAYLADDRASDRVAAESLRSEIEAATSESLAGKKVGTLSEFELASFDRGGPWPRPSTYSAEGLRTAHLAILRSQARARSETLERQRVAADGEKASGKAAPAPEAAAAEGPRGPRKERFQTVEANPEAYKGQTILLEDTYLVGTRFGRVEDHQLLPVKTSAAAMVSDGTSLRRPGLLMTVDDGLAQHYIGYLKQGRVPITVEAKQKCILMTEIRKIIVGGSPRWAAVIVFMQILTGQDNSSIINGQFDEALKVVDITLDGFHRVPGNPDVWIERLGGEKFLTGIKVGMKDYRRKMNTRQAREIFDQETNRLGEGIMRNKNRNDAINAEKQRRIMNGAIYTSPF